MHLFLAILAAEEKEDVSLLKTLLNDYLISSDFFGFISCYLLIEEKLSWQF